MPASIGQETDPIDFLCHQSGRFENAKEEQNSDPRSDPSVLISPSRPAWPGSLTRPVAELAHSVAW